MLDGELVGGNPAEGVSVVADVEADESQVLHEIAGGEVDIEVVDAVQSPVDGTQVGEAALGGASTGVNEGDSVGTLAQGAVEGAVDGGDVAGDVGEDIRQLVEAGAMAGGRGVQRYLLAYDIACSSGRDPGPVQDSHSPVPVSRPFTNLVAVAAMSVILDGR